MFDGFAIVKGVHAFVEKRGEGPGAFYFYKCFYNYNYNYSVTTPAASALGGGYIPVTKTARPFAQHPVAPTSGMSCFFGYNIFILMTKTTRVFSSDTR